MRAARDAGATAFLVPDGNCAEAAANAPDGLQLLRVGTLRDAVAGLDALRADQTPTSCGSRRADRRIRPDRTGTPGPNGNPTPRP